MIDVLVVGGGPAGLSAAVALRQAGAGRVVVVDREDELGGIPRSTEHTGYGLRDLRRLLTGPAYARRLVDDATAVGAELWPSTTVLDWAGERTLTVVGSGRPPEPVPARAVLLATGTRERPRTARLVPGDRPTGVLTTGSLQHLARLDPRAVGRRAVVVGAEHVSFSAVLTLTHARCRTVAMVTDLPRHQTSRALWLATAGRHRVPILTDVAVATIIGRRRVEAVELTDGRRLACDTVVFTGDWIPDHELARRGGLAMDAGTKGPVVDGALRTSRPGVFAAGNLLHGAETADVCALEGRHVAHAVAAWLDDGRWPTPSVPVRGEWPVRWVHPGVVGAPGVRPPRGRYLLRLSMFVPGRHLSVVQGTHVLWTGRNRHALVPNRSISLPAAWGDKADPEGPPVTVTVGDLR